MMLRREQSAAQEMARERRAKRDTARGAGARSRSAPGYYSVVAASSAAERERDARSAMRRGLSERRVMARH